MPKISVIIPTYNRAELLVSAVESILRQTEADIEVLVCDDGSTDDSFARISAVNDSRVRWIECGRGGRPAIPRNHGIHEAKGEWLAFLDSDDRWMPDKLQRQLAAMEENNLLASSTNALRIDASGNEIGKLIDLHKNKISFHDLIRLNYVVCSSVIIHSSLVDKVIGFPEDADLIVGEDYALWLRIACYTDFAYLSDVMVYYMDVPTQSVRGKGMLESFYKLQNRVLRDFLNWAPAEVNRFKIKAFLRIKLNDVLNLRRSVKRLFHRD